MVRDFAAKNESFGKEGLSWQVRFFLNNLAQPPAEALAATFFSDKKLLGAILFVALVAAAPLHALSAFVTIHAVRFVAMRSGALASGVSLPSLSVNAFFISVALSTCVPGSWQALILSVLAAPLIVIATVISRRFLMPWNLSPYVAPYLIVLWAFWYLGAYQKIVVLTLPPSEFAANVDLMTVLRSVALGFSQVFFVADVRLGVFIAVALIWSLRRTGVMMVTGGALVVFVGFLIGSDVWISHSGILAFPAILSVGALRLTPGRNVASLRMICVVAALAPFVGLLALRLAYFMGVPAFSLPFLVLMWGVQLYRDSLVHFESRAWSMR